MRLRKLKILQRTVDAAQYVGVPAACPPALRQSLLGVLRECPRKYMLSARFGIVPAETTEPIDVGTAFHLSMEFMLKYSLFSGDSLSEAFLSAWERDHVNPKLEKLSRNGIIASDAEAAVMRTELTQRGMKGLAMAKAFQASGHFPAAWRADSWKFWTEAELTAVHPETGQQISGRVDLVAFDLVRRVAWIVDFKTCSMSPELRARLALLEPQQIIYRFLVEDMLAHPSQIPIAGVRSGGWKLGGFAFGICQRPNITFCGKDRDFVTQTRTLESGPRRGETVSKQVPTSEPKFENYLARVTNWLRCEGEYAFARDQTPRMGWFEFKAGETATGSAYLHGLVLEFMDANDKPTTLQDHPPNPRACVGPGGRSVCPYLESFCAKPMSAWARAIESAFWTVRPSHEGIEPAAIDAEGGEHVNEHAPE